MQYAKSLLTLSAFGLALISQAADFNADFNETTNGANGWTYGYTTTLGGSLNVYSSFIDSGSNMSWTSPGLSGDATPSVFKRYGTPVNGVQTGEAGLHGGPSGEFSVARYTSVSGGTFNVVGMFGGGDIGAVSVYVRAGGTDLFSRTNTIYSEAFNLSSVSLGANESIDFIVGTAGDYRYDSTPLSATINPVPEPASMAALGLGALSILRRRRR